MNHINFTTTDIEIGGETWKAGETVRLKTESGDAWACSLILGFGTPDNGKTWQAKLARPYAYVSLLGISPTALTGVETYTVDADRMPTRFERLGKQKVGYSTYTT